MATMQSKNSKYIRYIGNRPKDDQDNRCREMLCHLVRDIGSFHEICADKLYLINLSKGENSQQFCEQSSKDPKSPFIFWGLYDSPFLTYEAFSMDFGPFNLAVTHQFCSKLKVWLDTQSIRDPNKCIVVVLDDIDTEKKLNATLLVAIAAMVLLNMSDQEVLDRLNFYMMFNYKAGKVKKELVFREKKKFTDVSGNPCTMSLTLEDCIRAFYAAIQFKFYDYYEFNHIDYIFYETVKSGDLNWIVPGKILAFAGPCEETFQSRLDQKHPPQFYHTYFNDHNVTTIVRLNKAEYASNKFTDFGFDHHDLIFPDGYPPTSTIAAKFIKIVDEARGAVAVHCYAGIGRTGTLIAAYLMARYQFTPQMAIAWTRICRPGSVIAEQQDWLFTKFDQFSVNKINTKLSRSRKPKSALQIGTVNLTDSEKTDRPKTTYDIAEKAYGQAEALLLAKKQRDNSDRPCTRNSILLNDIDAGDSTKPTQVSKASIILNLGKTIPLMFHLTDLKDLRDDEDPKFYHLKDGKYVWKIKFPPRGYVSLKYNHKQIKEDLESTSSNQYDRLFCETVLDFEQRNEAIQPGNQEYNLADMPNSKLQRQSNPVVYFGYNCYW